jgi:hypothetical protein
MDFISTILRVVQLLWTLLITALIGNVIYNNVTMSGNGQAPINFAMFVAVLSWIACLYGLAAGLMSALAIPIVLLVLDGLSVLFTFVAAVVLSAKLGAVNCNNLVCYVRNPPHLAFSSFSSLR